MNDFWKNLRYRFLQRAVRRYGQDELNRFLYIAALVCIILSFVGWFIRPLRFFWYLAIAAFVFSIFRSWSMNINARMKERDLYLKVKNKVSSFFYIQKRRWNERETHVFYTCPSCKTTVRVPRGRGKIEITCPKCRTKFIRKT